MKKRPGFFLLLMATLLMVCFVSVNALAWPVPDTGLTKCYDNEKEITCPSEGEAFCGQDACYNINPMSYTKLDATGNDLPDDAPDWTMVRDNVTGLIWEVKQAKDDTPDYANPHDADNVYYWYDSNPDTNGGDAGTPGNGTDTEDFINNLNATNYGGHNDWRLPTLKELYSIVDLSVPDPGPCINTAYFHNTQGFFYWSSTTNNSRKSQAWVVLFYSGYGNDDDKSDSLYVRAVRGGQSQSVFIDNGDGTVTDTSTGLAWQQNAATGSYSWEQALANCEALILGGRSDWRLPTQKELRSIVDYSQYNPAINGDFFPDTAASRYWSSTTWPYETNLLACAVYFYDGHDVGDGLKGDDYYVRAVRGGQAGSLGHPVILSPRQASSWETGTTMPIRWQTAGLGANVKISLSRQGGKDGTFETIISSTSNDGQEGWTVTGSGSVNCVIKIEQADNAANWATEGLFVINAPVKPVVNPGIYLLLLE